MEREKQVHPASFRDPSGYVFFDGKKLCRTVTYFYKEHYDFLMESGLYQELAEKGLLIPHQERKQAVQADSKVYKVIEPERIWFLNYPYEWSFSQLKDAALTTLKIAKTALGKGMILKDASAYNIQFNKGKPIFIDTLSFEKYRQGSPWIAYRQFCEFFLAPLALASYSDVRLSGLLQNFIGGVPLDLAAKLLPLTAKFNFGLATHLFIHSRIQQKYSAPKNVKTAKRAKLPLHSFQALLDSLERTVSMLKAPLQDTEWGNYYEETNYSSRSFKFKAKTVEEFVEQERIRSLWDVGGNNGKFSRLAAKQKIPVLCSDIDPLAVEQNYLLTKKNKDEFMLPLVNDLTNPAPAVGWANEERASFLSRINLDGALVLALIHHLAISNNLPLFKVAALFAKTARKLLIEFVPKEDSKVQLLLSSRKDIFKDYHRQGFEAAFSGYFNIKKIISIEGSKRDLYIMVRK